MNKESMQKKLKWITWPLIVVSFIISVAGYLVAGFSVPNAIYATVGVFHFSLTDVPEMNIWLEFARWLAPFSIATTVFIQIGPLFCFVRDRFFFLKYRCLIYSDTEMGKALYQSRGKTGGEKEKLKIQAVLSDKKTIYRGEKKAKTIIVMMKDDRKAFQIYDRIRKYKNTRIILSLNSLEPNLIPSTGKTTLFNSNDLIAGAFWDNQLKLKEMKKETEDGSFWKAPDRDIHIVINGYGMLGRRLLYKGLLLNLFSLQQKIVYHVITEDYIEKKHLMELRRCCKKLTYNDNEILPDEVTAVNLDEIHFYQKADDCEIINQAEAVILTEESDPGELQKWLYITRKTVIYYFDPKGSRIEYNLSVEERGKIDLEASKPYERLTSYGVYSKVIRADKLIYNRLNDEARSFYMEYYMAKQRAEKGGDDWEKLPGFKRGLFLNQVDYSEIGVLDWHDLNINAKLGHMHWCRYYLLNHWFYDNKEKDWENRTHPCLVSYDVLDKDKKEKNEAIISYLIKRNNKKEKENKKIV